MNTIRNLAVSPIMTIIEGIALTAASLMLFFVPSAEAATPTSEVGVRLAESSAHDKWSVNFFGTEIVIREQCYENVYVDAQTGRWVASTCVDYTTWMDSHVGTVSLPM